MHALAGIAGLVARGLARRARSARAVPWRAVVAGLVLQLVLAVVFLKVTLVKEAFLKLNDALLVLEQATQAGTGLVFGYLGGGPAPFEVSDTGATFVLAFRALPIVLVMSALSALLFYWRVLPAIVRALSLAAGEARCASAAWSGSPPRRTSSSAWSRRRSSCGPISPRVSRGELFAIMVGGMASIAGTVLFLYAAILAPGAARRGGAPAHRLDPFGARGARHRLPHGAAEGAVTGGNVELRSEASSSMDALTRGTLDGAQLLLNIVAMLVVFVALVALVNLVIAPYSLQGALGWAARAARLALRHPVERGASAAGALLGTKTVINELVAYVELSKLTRSLRAQPRADDLRALRLRQLRQPRHHDRRPGHHVPRAARRGGGARAEVDRRRHARHLPHRGDASRSFLYVAAAHYSRFRRFGDSRRLRAEH